MLFLVYNNAPIARLITSKTLKTWEKFRRENYLQLKSARGLIYSRQIYIMIYNRAEDEFSGSFIAPLKSIFSRRIRFLSPATRTHRGLVILSCILHFTREKNIWLVALSKSHLLSKLPKKILKYVTPLYANNREKRVLHILRKITEFSPEVRLTSIHIIFQILYPFILWQAIRSKESTFLFLSIYFIFFRKIYNFGSFFFVRFQKE